MGSPRNQQLPVRIGARVFLVLAFLLVSRLGLFAYRASRGASTSSPDTGLAAQLRDRGTVAVLGGRTWSIPSSEATLVSASSIPALSTALDRRDAAAAAEAFRAAHLDGLLVRTDTAAGNPTTTGRALSEMRPVDRLTASYLDETAALYETREDVQIDTADTRRLITVARLILSGAVAPPERIFPESLRRTRPVEIALTLRDGHDAVLWRSTRGGSVARAFLDVCFAVLDRWGARQQDRYGRMREALRTLSLTLSVFYDKGVLGTRSPDFLRRAADPRVWAVGYERLATWEYSLPPSPWGPAADPTAALRALTRERGVAEPGHLRPELTLYRFRALQMIEASPGGEIQVFDPR